MNGMEAKYTAKHIAKLIKHNNKMEKRNRKAFDLRNNEDDFQNFKSLDGFAVAQFLQKETRKLALEFRAFMIHNAFKKGRDFTSAEVMFYGLDENALTELLSSSKEGYSLYMDKRNKQQKAIRIVLHTLLSTDAEKVQFISWIEAAQAVDKYIYDAVKSAIEKSRKSLVDDIMAANFKVPEMNS